MNGEAFPSIDPWVAVGVLVMLGIVFCLGQLVPRRLAVVQVAAPASEGKLDTILAKLSEVEERVAQCEHDGKNIRQVVGELPTKRVVDEMSNKVSAMTGVVEGMASGQLANTQQLGMIQEFLFKAASDSLMGRRRRQSDDHDSTRRKAPGEPGSEP